MKPLVIDLYCGLGGWAEGFLAEGWEVFGFDNGHTAPYGVGVRYPGQLVIQDVLTLHGSQFASAECIVASPPCQNYSYLAMPWSRSKSEHSQKAKEMRRKWETEGPDNRLFDACFRIQREAMEAFCNCACWRCRSRGHCVRCDCWHNTGIFPKRIPLIVENVRGAIPWVGRSAWNFGSFHLWGDVPALMPIRAGRPKVPGFRFDGSGRSFQTASVAEWRKRNPDGTGIGPDSTEGTKLGGDWFSDPNSTCQKHGSRSNARRMASAMIAKIPFALSSHIARVYKPKEN
jgi:hypothetical protein